MTTLIEVPGAKARAIWPEIAGLIRKGIDLTRYGVEDVLSGIERGEYQLWLVADGEKVASVFVSRINVYPRCREAAILLAAGTRREAWVHHMDDFQSWASANGCQAMMILGRKGWLKEERLKTWRYASVILEKELPNAEQAAA